MAHACRMTDLECVHKKLVDQICKDLEAMGPDFANDDWDETIAIERSYKKLKLKRYKIDLKALGMDIDRSKEFETHI